MAQLDLQPREAELLLSILNEFLADLREEIVSTEEYTMRQNMKKEEGTIKSLIARLREQTDKRLAA